MRLIDADALKQIAQEHGFTFVDFQALDNAPTIDAVPVVRCKDCTEFDEKEQECSVWCGFRENDFCSYGVRKDGAEDEK